MLSYPERKRPLPQAPSPLPPLRSLLRAEREKDHLIKVSASFESFWAEHSQVEKKSQRTISMDSDRKKTDERKRTQRVYSFQQFPSSCSSDCRFQLSRAFRLDCALNPLFCSARFLFSIRLPSSLDQQQQQRQLSTLYFLRAQPTAHTRVGYFFGSSELLPVTLRDFRTLEAVPSAENPSTLFFVLLFIHVHIPSSQFQIPQIARR